MKFQSLFFVLLFFFESTLQSQIVKTTGNLSLRRTNLSACASDKWVYFSGGRAYSGVTGRIDVYDSFGKYVFSDELAQPREFHTSHGWQNKIFFVGGKKDDTSAASSIEIYDEKSQTFLSPVILPVPRAMHCAVVWNNQLVLMAGVSGFTERDSFITQINVLDLTTLAWQKTDMFLASGGRTNAQINLYNNQLLLCGGRNLNLLPKAVESIDLKSKTSKLFTITEGRDEFASFVYDSFLCFFGGETENSFATNLEKINIETAESEQIETGIVAAGLKSSGVLNKRFVFIGGGRIPGKKINLLFVYEPITKSWTIDSISQSREGIASVVFNNTLFLGGGYLGSQAYSNRIDFIQIPKDFSIVPAVKNFDIKIGPNPISKVLNVYLSANLIPNQITIISAEGKRVLVAKNTKIVDCTQLSAGAYFLEIEANSTLYKEKILVLR